MDSAHDATDATDSSPRNESPAADAPTVEIAGRQAVIGIYAVAVVLAAGFGSVLALTVDPGTTAHVGPIRFPITPVSLAVYGAVSVGAGLGVFMGLAALAASRAE